ncbi:sensor histidine kinase [Allorhizocola rhizosphaerae]|uniref:sensor histidine kinase n=1 Tax=Allorhizocola rhizosphaerae TaxID=1872709 RepID=UPI000E3D0965|nr:sensor domain-containing protein [Allorhizocola rhizosphaerae]
MTKRSFLRGLGRDSAYVLTGLPLAIASFAVLVPGLALAVGTAVAGIGVWVGAGALLAARVFADLERIRLPHVLDRPLVRPVYRRSEHQGKWRRALTVLGDLQSWLDLVHGLLTLIVSGITFALVLVWWAMTLGGLLNFAYDWALPHGAKDGGLHVLMGMADTRSNRVLVITGIGVIAALTLPLIVRGCALLRASFARSLLTGVAEVRNRIDTLKVQKAAAVSAEATALRRLERDIHDGPQQRLVRLAMDISRAKQQVSRDPQLAVSTLDEALTQTRETLDELRSLSRGIAPPVLADRGLPSALAALAGRSTVPVDLAIEETLPRLDPAVENAAYFIVAEALANVAKHSRATVAEVTVVRAAGVLGVLIRDDGVGGAHVSKGHGLAGLADRVRATGGDLTINSPDGGGTEIRAELPT